MMWIPHFHYVSLSLGVSPTGGGRRPWMPSAEPVLWTDWGDRQDDLFRTSHVFKKVESECVRDHRGKFTLTTCKTKRAFGRARLRVQFSDCQL